jgi:hypothetical protein
MTRNARHGVRSVNFKGIFVRQRGVKIKLKGKSATSAPKAIPSNSSELRGWPAIAQFLGMPNSTVHRWAKEGMPVRRERRNVVASPEQLNQWLQRTSGEAAKRKRPVNLITDERWPPDDEQTQRETGFSGVACNCLRQEYRQSVS